MAFRSEEEKTHDIIMYEKKAKASELCQKYENIKKRTSIATAIATVVFGGIAVPVFYKAYDNESFAGMIAVVLTAFLLIMICKTAVGAILSHSLSIYLKWGSLSAKWAAARKDMHEYEAKFADQTVFEDDMKIAEKKLMDASDAIISFAEKNGISVE